MWKYLIVIFTIIENNKMYMYKGSLQYFYWKKGNHEILDVVCSHYNVDKHKMILYLYNILNWYTHSDDMKVKYKIGWIYLKCFTSNILLYQQNHTIILFLKIMDILQLEHLQVSLINTKKQDFI